MRRAIPESEFQSACDEYLGWCSDCGDFTREQTEPDAEHYDCPDCGGRNVTGAENALLGCEFALTDG